jgi:hypothetical protein
MSNDFRVFVYGKTMLFCKIHKRYIMVITATNFSLFLRKIEIFVKHFIVMNLDLDHALVSQDGEQLTTQYVESARLV